MCSLRGERDQQPMTRLEIVLAAMASGGESVGFNAIQIQKLLFLIDKEIPDLVGGSHFQFEAGGYGPCDGLIYEDLERLFETGEATVDESAPVPAYSLTPSGFRRGTQVLAILSDEARRFITAHAEWVLWLPVTELLAAIFDSYPEMAVNREIQIRRASYPRPLDYCSKTRSSAAWLGLSTLLEHSVGTSPHG